MEERNRRVLPIVAFPAYGRRYASAASMRQDWDAGKDFQIQDGPYFSSRDLPALKDDGYRQVTLFQHKPWIKVVVEVK